VNDFAAASNRPRLSLAAAHDRLATIRGRNTTPAERDSDPSAFAHLMSALAAYRTGSMHAALDEVAQALQVDRGPRLQSAARLLAAAARLSLGRFDAAAKSFTTAHAIIEIERLYSSYSIIAPTHVHELSALTGLAVHSSAVSTDLTATTGAALAALSRRERQVLVLLASDLSLQSIADTLFVSKNTVKTTTNSLYRKLGVNSRQAAADIAQRTGIA
jgi:ATP/maltotriose-dependent transcriptional regulator MalT